MLYTVSKEVAINTLKNKVLATSNCIQFLNKEGYIPNKHKFDVLSWNTILLRAFNSYDIFTESRKNKLQLLYHRVQTL